MIKSIKTIPVVLVAIVSLTASCVKKDDYDTDTPSTNVDPNLTANIDIDSLQTLSVNGENPTYINDDLICVGIVAADDKSGNFYKEIVLQDATGGISLLIDQSDYYTTYPIGRRVFVKLRGLYIADVDGNKKIGMIETGGGLGSIPNTSLTSHLFPGKWNLEVAVKQKKLSQITLADINTLVEFDTVQFESSDIGRTFADAITHSDASKYLQDCDGNSITVRTSGYANFASAAVPCKGGKVRGVVQYYGATPQIFLRNLDDIQVSLERCGIVSTPTDTIDEDFTGIPIAKNVSGFNGWTSYTAVGDAGWEGAGSGTATYTQASAYYATGALETWLVSPPIDLATADTLQFQSQTAFFVNNHTPVSVWFTPTFDICNPGASVWQQINGATLANSTSGTTWVSSGALTLTAFTGTGYISFKYEGNKTTGLTMNFRIDNVTIH